MTLQTDLISFHRGMHRLYMPWPPSKIACKCSVHRIFVKPILHCHIHIILCCRMPAGWGLQFRKPIITQLRQRPVKRFEIFGKYVYPLDVGSFDGHFQIESETHSLESGSHSKYPWKLLPCRHRTLYSKLPRGNTFGNVSFCRWGSILHTHLQNGMAHL